MVKQSLTKLLSIMPLSLARELFGGNPLLPYQHTVSDEYLPHISEIYPFKNRLQFERDLTTIRKYSNNIPLEEALNMLSEGKKCPKGTIILSFDDGFREIHDVVSPMLKDAGTNAIFFINPAFIDNKQLFYRHKISVLLSILKSSQQSKQNEIAALMNCASNFSAIRNNLLLIKNPTNPKISQIQEVLHFDERAYLNSRKPYLSSNQIQSLADQGFLFGGHSLDHPYYDQLTLPEQIRQTVESTNWLKCIESSQKHQLFSFPHSDALITNKFFAEDAVRKIDLFFGIQNMKEESWNRVYHRFNAERPEFNLSSQIKAMAGYFVLNKLLQRSKVLRNN